MTAVQSKGLPLAGRKEPDVNGLPLSMVDQWQEYPTKRTFAVSVPTELRRRYYPNDAVFSQAMRKAGYVPVRTRKLTGKQSSFWLYRVTGNDKEVCTAEPALRKASAPVVQTITKPHPWFKRVALDGKWQHVYADHIHLLTKKRHRVDGVRVQGYSAAGLTIEVIALGVGHELAGIVGKHPTAVTRSQNYNPLTGGFGFLPDMAEDTRSLRAKADEYNLKVILPSLKGTFGGNPTEGERAALMQSQNGIKSATSNDAFLRELNKAQDVIVRMQKRQISGLGIPVTKSQDEETDTKMLLQDPSLVKDYVTAHGYLPESYYQAKLKGGY